MTAGQTELEGILDQADELADRFEAFDTSAAAEIPVHEYLLERSLRTSPEDGVEIARAVAAARRSGTAWSRIGQIMEMSARDAEQWYMGVVEPPSPSGLSLV